MALTLSGLGIVLLINYLSLLALSLPLTTLWHLAQRNAHYFAELYIYQNYALECTASPWNAYKVGLMALNKAGLISTVDFNYDAPFIQDSFSIYSVLMGLLVLLLLIHVLLIEKEMPRCAAVLLLYLSISTPSGGDYRLLYVAVALVPLVLLKSKRKCDLVILVITTLIMVPKKYLFLTFAGKTETNFNDVSSDVVLNPLLVLTALLLLLLGGWAQLDRRWTTLRLIRLCRAISPRLTNLLLPGRVTQPQPQGPQ